MLDERMQLYNFKVDPDSFNTPHAKFIKMIGHGKRVLEVGCASGTFSAYLSGQLNCEVVGVELNPEAASSASKYCSSVIVGDVEKGALDQVSGPFDFILFADVLEHLVCPGDVLRRCRSLLGKNGSILVSIPNIAHYSVRMRLLRGRFEYEQYGLLDKTHLRFFTLKTARRLLEEAGLTIVESDVVYSLRGLRILRLVPRYEVLLKTVFANLVGWQFIFRATAQS